MTQQRSSNGKALLLTAGDFDSTLSDQRIQTLVRARQQAVTCSLLQYGHALIVGGRRIHEQQILANAAGEKLSVLSDKSNAFSQAVQIDVIKGKTVVSDVAGLRPVQAHQKLN